MTTHTVTSRLGHNILVVMESAPAFHEALRACVAALPEVERRSFTLLGCCPPRFWEHSGGESADVAKQAQRMQEAKRQDFSRLEQCLEHAASLLREAGVPAQRIAQRLVTGHERMLPAVMAELRRARYSGVIISAHHADIINRLERRGVTDLFRSVPRVAVEALELQPAAGQR
ncbi:MAG: hypothetical protein ACUVSX_06720 [Aggregatilineales bacterium]